MATCSWSSKFRIHDLLESDPDLLAKTATNGEIEFLRREREDMAKVKPSIPDFFTLYEAAKGNKKDATFE